MSIIARIRPTVQTRAHRVAPIMAVPFGFGIEVESAKERHQREQFEVGDAVFMGRATRLPLDSPNYAAFVAAMNAPAEMPSPALPRGFYTSQGAYVPTDLEDAFAAAAFADLEEERLEARWEALADEAFENDRLSGRLIEDEMFLIGACG